MVYVLDTEDPAKAAEFWAPTLGFHAEEEREGSAYLSLRDPEGRLPDLLLQRVPEAKHGKNRMHIDLHVADAEAELTRLRGLGARVVRPFFEEEGHRLAVLSDPEGNEFCVIQPGSG